MSLDTYANFKAAIADHLARSDLTSQIVDCITLFEADAARELFRMRGAETIATLTPAADGTVALPSDYLGWRRVTWLGSSLRDLEYVQPQLLRIYFPDSPTDTPEFFTIEGSTLKIRPFDTTNIEFDYFAKTPALSSSLNWLFTNNVDAYWAGTLEQCYSYIKDYDQAAVWQTKKEVVFEKIKTQRFREDGTLIVRVVGATP